MTKIRFELAPKFALAEKAAQGKTGFVPPRPDGSLSGQMLGWSGVSAWSRTKKRSLSHATANLNLCFIRLMLKRLASS
jgi:hypothetical protein